MLAANGTGFQIDEAWQEDGLEKKRLSLGNTSLGCADLGGVVVLKAIRNSLPAASGRTIPGGGSGVGDGSDQDQDILCWS